MWWLVMALVVAQGSLADAAERARSAWLAHDPQHLIGQGGKHDVGIGQADTVAREAARIDHLAKLADCRKFVGQTEPPELFAGAEQ